MIIKRENYYYVVGDVMKIKLNKLSTSADSSKINEQSFLYVSFYFHTQHDRYWVTIKVN